MSHDAPAPLASRDVTVAFTPLQLVLIAVLGIFLLRLLRRWWAEARARELLDRA